MDFARSPAARWAGLIASGAALAAFLFVLVKTVSAEDARRLLLHHWGALLGALFLYCLAYVPMTKAWIVLARACGARIPNVELARIFLTSQIAKYLPGNVAQFVGRAWAGQARGIPLKVLGTAMALEVAGVLAACAVLAGAALGSGLVAPESSEYGRPALSVGIGLAAAGALLGSMLAFRGREGRESVLGPFVAATVCYLVLLGLLAGANILLVAEISGDLTWVMTGQVAAAFAVSWLVGFVTPGSPAGLGLRELTFFSILAGSYPNETLVLAAAAFRLTTVTGDLMAWMSGILLSRSRHYRPLAA
jgi:glycosyltransferase 2 family protein